MLVFVDGDQTVDLGWWVKVKTTVRRMLQTDIGHQNDSFGHHSLPFSLINYDVPRSTSLQRVYCKATSLHNSTQTAINGRMALHLVLGRCSTVAFGIPYLHLAGVHSVCRAFYSCVNRRSSFVLMQHSRTFKSCMFFLTQASTFH